MKGIVPTGEILWFPVYALEIIIVAEKPRHLFSVTCFILKSRLVYNRPPGGKFSYRTNFTEISSYLRSTSSKTQYCFENN